MVLSLFGTVGDDKTLDSANAFFTFLYAVEIGPPVLSPFWLRTDCRECSYAQVSSRGCVCVCLCVCVWLCLNVFVALCEGFEGRRRRPTH